MMSAYSITLFAILTTWLTISMATATDVGVAWVHSTASADFALSSNLICNKTEFPAVFLLDDVHSVKSTSHPSPLNSSYKDGFKNLIKTAFVDEDSIGSFPKEDYVTSSTITRNNSTVFHDNVMVKQEPFISKLVKCLLPFVTVVLLELLVLLPILLFVGNAGHHPITLTNFSAFLANRYQQVHRAFMQCGRTFIERQQMVREYCSTMFDAILGKFYASRRSLATAFIKHGQALIERHQHILDCGAHYAAIRAFRQRILTTQVRLMLPAPTDPASTMLLVQQHATFQQPQWWNYFMGALEVATTLGDLCDAKLWIGAGQKTLYSANIFNDWNVSLCLGGLVLDDAGDHIAMMLNWTCVDPQGYITGFVSYVHAGEGERFKRGHFADWANGTKLDEILQADPTCCLEVGLLPPLLGQQVPLKLDAHTPTTKIPCSLCRLQYPIPLQRDSLIKYFGPEYPTVVTAFKLHFDFVEAKSHDLN